MSLIRQSVALSAANLKSLPRRLWISVSMVFSVALVVTVLLGFLAMSNGFRTSLQQAGAQDIAIALGTGASTELGSQIEPSQLHLLSGAEGIARDANGTPIISTELVVPVDASVKGSGLYETLSLRGIGAFGLTVRPLVQITEGRAFTPGAAEIVVGRRLSADYQGLSLGDQVTFGTSVWTVVGIFDAQGSVFESEMFADAAMVQTLFKRPNLVQSARIQLTSAEALAPLAKHAETTAQIALPLKSEQDYFAGMAQSTSRLILFLGWPLAITMAAGAVIGALTTMYSSVSDRSTEIATVRTIGFSRRAAFVGTWVEAMVLTLLGCAVGVAVAWFGLDGWSASTTGADQTQIGFQLALSPALVGQAVILSLVIGAIGGGLPALNATRIPLRLAMTGRS
ncbi:ABC transporter permease [Tropicibacter oceani]|uniref:FtsX-like permease family protein n=1 Tax=Tropicibacter oceani TaxID=3058420 RepID=A0ABY8QKH4_9RHOB|nr:FtsX-like permease family protein [Tropicibacter oceani]WGW04508.1 FtsX-like permease family protein [Tropicibacter oceani]